MRAHTAATASRPAGLSELRLRVSEAELQMNWDDFRCDKQRKHFDFECGACRARVEAVIDALMRESKSVATLAGQLLAKQVEGYGRAGREV